ncbi:hypothetical protein [Streptomyces silvensis]|uniref:Uncharacterized protein n=1 Tax=Streptomyces silvensis TaxID=1765722 RepID=A0A0W7X6B1_9ACTN|nr:hypothetical protein [Streptomyces silvensis]KUF18478.1 hypothetical protein AT728_19225 [Streptomyces silvensis]
MSPNLQPSGPVRPAAAVNEDIRALWTDPRIGLTHEQRARYEHLLIEWITATRAAQIVIAA